MSDKQQQQQQQQQTIDTVEKQQLVQEIQEIQQQQQHQQQEPSEPFLDDKNDKNDNTQVQPTTIPKHNEIKQVNVNLNEHNSASTDLGTQSEKQGNVINTQQENEAALENTQKVEKDTAVNNSLEKEWEEHQHQHQEQHQEQEQESTGENNVLGNNEKSGAINKLYLEYSYAGQAEIIRANQKDTQYSQILFKKIYDCILDFNTGSGSGGGGGSGGLQGSRRRMGMGMGIGGINSWIRMVITSPKHTRILHEFTNILYNILTIGVLKKLDKSSGIGDIGGQQQTLGEEYCGIMKISTSTKTYPSMLKLLVDCSIIHILKIMVLVIGKQSNSNSNSNSNSSSSFNSRTAIRTFSKTSDNNNDNNGGGDKRTRRLVNVTTRIVDTIRYLITKYNVVQVLQVVERMNTCSFYFFGKYYEMVKRILGIRYILLRKANSDNGDGNTNGSEYEVGADGKVVDYIKSHQSSGYEILGLMILVQLIVEGVRTTYNNYNLKDKSDSEMENVKLGDDGYRYKNENKNKNQEAEEEEAEREEQMRKVLTISQKTCNLCLENMKHPSVLTSCGHMFCWNCVFEWINVQGHNDCPLCRQPVPRTSSIVPIYGY